MAWDPVYGFSELSSICVIIYLCIIVHEFCGIWYMYIIFINTYIARICAGIILCASRILTNLSP